MLERLPTAALGALVRLLGLDELLHATRVSKAWRGAINLYLVGALFNISVHDESKPVPPNVVRNLMGYVMQGAAQAGLSTGAVIQAILSGMECNSRGHRLVVAHQRYRRAADVRTALTERLKAYDREGDRQGPMRPQQELLKLCAICEAVAKAPSGAMTPGAAATTSGVTLDVVWRCCRAMSKPYVGGKATAVVVDGEEVAMAKALWGRGRPTTELSLLEVGTRHLQVTENVTPRDFSDNIHRVTGAQLLQLTDLTVKAWLDYFSCVFMISAEGYVKLRASPTSVPPTPLSQRLSDFVDRQLPGHHLCVLQSTCKKSTFKTPPELVSICPKRYGQKQHDAERASPHVVALQSCSSRTCCRCRWR